MMISRDIMIEGINYTVSATTLRGLDEAIEYLQASLTQDKKRQIEQLEEELNRDFDEVLQKFETGELPEQEEPKEEPKPKLSKKPGRPRKNEE